jgi:hypothetical protein
MKIKPNTLYAVMAVLAIALAVNLGAAAALGLRRPMVSDAYYFRDIAENLARGQGFRQTESLWPGTLTMTRLPGWPFVVAGVLRMAPGADPDMAMRLTSIAVNSLAAVAVAMLAIRLFSRPAVGLAAGALYALHPTGIYSTYTGLSEPLFAMTMLGGVLLLLSRGMAWNIAGFALVGYACLVRPNYVLWGAAAAGVVTWLALRRRITLDRQTVAVGLLGLAVIALPVLLWAWRNHQVCGHFPVVSTIQGQTFYGGNNNVVAARGRYWGYWVFPDQIEGEQTMASLAGVKSEYEVNRYYQKKGVEFVAGHLSAMPMLWLGKLVRAFVPVPWNVTVETMAVSVYRWLLFIGAIAGMVLMWSAVDVRYRVALLAMVAATLATVLWFWGCARFAFAMEPFLIPFAAAAVWRVWERRFRAT